MEVGVMPNETIISNDGSKLTVQWGRQRPDDGRDSTETPEDPSVLLTSWKAWEDPSGGTGGWNPTEAWHLDAATIDRLIPVLRRASNQAYGGSGGEMTNVFSVHCICGVMAGGVRSPRDDCPAHTGPSRSFTITIPYTL
jgi:hypothetical protein